MIKVLIKNPSVKFQDFEVEVEETKTIAELKLHLSLVYPTNPLPGFQKLFFAGKLLRNEETLSSLLQQNLDSNQKVVFHLVISRPENSPTFQAYPRPQIPVQNVWMGNRQEGQGGQLPENPNPNPNAPQQERGGQNMFWLFVRLAFLVWFLSHGNYQRALILSGIALVIFLYQTGILKTLMPQAPGLGPNNRPQPNPDQNDAPANPPPPLRQPIRPNGLIGELTALVVPFLFSLFPTYQHVQAN